MSRKIIILAGPNGAGKTTFARSFLPEQAQCPHVESCRGNAALRGLAPACMALAPRGAPA